jgi:biotin operon repressor
MQKDRVAEVLRLIFPAGVKPEEFPFLLELLGRLGGQVEPTEEVAPGIRVGVNPGATFEPRAEPELPYRQQQVMDALSAGGRMTMPEIAKALGIPHDAVRAAIRALTAKGVHVVRHKGQGKDVLGRPADVFEVG